MALLDRLAARWTLPTEVQRRAFRGQFSEGYCDEMGTKTRAALVLRDALSWAAIIDRELQKPYAREIRYAPLRFAWYLDCVGQLGEAIDAQATSKGSAGSARSRQARAIETARATVTDLRTAVNEVAGDASELQDEVDKVPSAGDAPDEVARTLEGLADLIEGWEEREDEELEVLLAAQNLSSDDAVRARAAASRLLRAYEGTRGGRVDERDPPAVNRIEGRVLLEMRTARRAFDAARGRNKLVARLVPGRGTRGVLGSRSPAEEEEEKKKTRGKEAGKEPPTGGGGSTQGQGEVTKGEATKGEATKGEATKGEAADAGKASSPAKRAKARRARKAPRRR